MILNLKDSFSINRKPYDFLSVLCHAGLKTERKKKKPPLPLSDNSVELQGATLGRACLRY